MIVSARNEIINITCRYICAHVCEPNAVCVSLSTHKHTSRSYVMVGCAYIFCITGHRIVCMLKFHIPEFKRLARSYSRESDTPVIYCDKDSHRKLNHNTFLRRIKHDVVFAGFRRAFRRTAKLSNTYARRFGNLQLHCYDLPPKWRYINPTASWKSAAYYCT